MIRCLISDLCLGSIVCVWGRHTAFLPDWLLHLPPGCMWSPPTHKQYLHIQTTSLVSPYTVHIWPYFISSCLLLPPFYPSHRLLWFLQLQLLYFKSKHSESRWIFVCKRQMLYLSACVDVFIHAAILRNNIFDSADHFLKVRVGLNVFF